MPRILVVDDEEKMGVLVSGALEDAGYNVTVCTTGADAIARISEKVFDVVVTDLKMDPPDGLAVLKEARKANSETEVIMMTAFASAQTAVDAMKAGAFDYLIKPFSLDELTILVERILESKRKAARTEQLEDDLAGMSHGDFIGESTPVRILMSMVEKVAATDANVLILGKSGTGKELIANQNHRNSGRASGPFVAVNCGALTETLLESELFGHEKGAFTGAIKRKMGRFELAASGTLFLDEIGEIRQSVQVKLLRALEERKITRVGGTEEISVDVRVIAATNRDLELELEEQRFREDLFYRLNVFPINMPTLAERREDIPILSNHFAHKLGYAYGELGNEVINHLAAYVWPGNVRELKNVIERALILAAGDQLTTEHLTIRPKQSVVQAPSPQTESLNLDDLEKRAVLDALEKTGGNKTKAAKMLNITRRMLYSRMDKYDIK